MRPIAFPECNVNFGAGQEGVETLPAARQPDGVVISCWEFTPEELAYITQHGKIWLSQHTYNAPLQPVLLTASWPGSVPQAALRPSA